NPSGNGWKSMDLNDSVYARAPNSDHFTEPLTRMDKNWNVIPGMADKWTVDSTGKVWTFTLHPGVQWSDGTPVTADDYVASFRYAADPKHAWDFAWYFSGVIKNFTDINKGKVPVDQLGMKTGANKNELMIETE